MAGRVCGGHQRWDEGGGLGGENVEVIEAELCQLFPRTIMRHLLQPD